jgi:hypothetical protein
VFLVSVKNPDGSEQSPQVLANFNCLQQTGDFCSNSGGGGMASLILNRPTASRRTMSISNRDRISTRGR